MNEFCRMRRNERYAACADAVTIWPLKSLVLQGFWEGTSAQARCLYHQPVFSRANGYTSPEPKSLYREFVHFSIYGGNLPMAKNEGNSNYSYMTRRIGGTTYKVKVVFNDEGQETLEDKILRIICNEAVTNGGTYDIINSPQMSRRSERSAS